MCRQGRKGRRGTLRPRNRRSWQTGRKLLAGNCADIPQAITKQKRRHLRQSWAEMMRAAPACNFLELPQRHAQAPPTKCGSLTLTTMAIQIAPEALRECGKKKTRRGVDQRRPGANFWGGYLRGLDSPGEAFRKWLAEGGSGSPCSASFLLALDFVPRRIQELGRHWARTGFRRFSPGCILLQREGTNSTLRQLLFQSTRGRIISTPFRHSSSRFFSVVA